MTPRELEVLQRMAAGRTNAGIAATLHLSESAVKKHAAQVFLKLVGSTVVDTHRRVAAVVTYLRESG